MLPPVAPQTSTPTAAISEVDVASKLEALASQQGEQLNWRTSIVDLLKLLNIDSSLAARKELATEMPYTGSTDDSAAMNIWLHSAVMEKLAENGGKVPGDPLNKNHFTWVQILRWCLPCLRADNLRTTVRTYRRCKVKKNTAPSLSRSSSEH
ncbi:DUF3597 domain-containing protein [Pseudomonas silesiensis]|uniref:DUF3597 domain-containing protein n=1 Tax=Pseudomonas silesiensis TaxID=1853130 RepID=UPI003B845537